MQTRVIGNGRYHLEKRLGQGGFGTTWLAADQENQQKVVVKELCPPQGEKREKEIRNFLREARVMASLHAVKEIVKVLNYFEEQGNAYIVMEYLRVTSLRHYLECQEEPLSFEKARDMLLPVMEGLEKMHEKHILHRDLTPDNLMLREDGISVPHEKLQRMTTQRQFFLKRDMHRRNNMKNMESRRHGQMSTVSVQCVMR